MRRPRAIVTGLSLVTVALTAHCGNAPAPHVVPDGGDAWPAPHVGRDAAMRDGSATTSGANGSCRSASDCTIAQAVFVLCWNGGPRDLPFTGCGELFADRCATDLDCADAGPGDLCVAENICGGTICGPRCTNDSDCGTSGPGAFSCLANGHCGATPCEGTTDCPVDYGCVAKRCGAKCCTSDADCAGFCVTERARPSWGPAWLAVRARPPRSNASRGRDREIAGAAGGVTPGLDLHPFGVGIGSGGGGGSGVGCGFGFGVGFGVGRGFGSGPTPSPYPRPDPTRGGVGEQRPVPVT